MSFGQTTLEKIGESFVEKAVDAVLLAAYFNLEAPFLVRNKRKDIEGQILDDLERFNYQTLKRAYLHLRKKGLVQALKEAQTLPEITQAGRKRIGSMIPFYDEKRVWDGRIYLVSYDLPVKRNNEREYLRVFLRKIGCGMLQQSIWLTPYNPTNLLKEFIHEHQLSEEIILVSSIGKDGTVGEMAQSELMERVYCLSSLNQEYKKFISACNCGKETRGKLIFWFLALLKRDPQIPFCLLPDDWAGTEAYRLLKKSVLPLSPTKINRRCDKNL